MFGFGATELLIILALVLIVFGAGKLPKIAGSLGRGIREFKDAVDTKQIENDDERLERDKQV